VSPRWKYEVYEKVLKKAGKDIVPWIMKHPSYGKERDALRFAQALSKDGSLGWILSEEEEFETLKSAEYLYKQEFGCKVKVIQSHESDSEKAHRADPGKPGIEIS
jgi:hypothetical protein